MEDYKKERILELSKQGVCITDISTKVKEQKGLVKKVIEADQKKLVVKKTTNNFNYRGVDYSFVRGKYLMAGIGAMSLVSVKAVENVINSLLKEKK